jgi:hypothetical protein
MIDLTKIAQLVMMRKALILFVEGASLFIAACLLLAAAFKVISVMTEAAQECLRLYSAQPALLQLVLFLFLAVALFRFATSNYYSIRSYVLLFIAMQEANKYAAAYAAASSRRTY